MGSASQFLQNVQFYLFNKKPGEPVWKVDTSSANFFLTTIMLTEVQMALLKEIIYITTKIILCTMAFIDQLFVVCV
jgi:hypothetical protein